MNREEQLAAAQQAIGDVRRRLPRYLVQTPTIEGQYRIPVPADPYRYLLMPTALLAWPYPGPRREQSFSFTWGGRPYPPGVGPAELAILPRPAIHPNRVRWFEPTAFGLKPATGAASEVLRTNLLAPGAAVLRKIATYLKVVFLDNAGGIVGTPFVTNQDTDPALQEIPHPTIAGFLSFQWVLVADEFDGAEPLFTGPIGDIPTGHTLDGIPWSWPDLRYTWGNRYTEAHNIIVPPETRVRLFVQLTPNGQTVAGNYRVTAGGLLAGAWQNSSRAAIVSIEDWIS